MAQSLPKTIRIVLSKPSNTLSINWGKEHESDGFRLCCVYCHMKDLNLVPEAGFFNNCGWLSRKFGSNASSRIFFGWLTAYTKFG